MSIPANTVEGRGQKSDRQFARFLGYAINSSSELDYHLIVARDAKLISLADSRSLLDQTIEVRKMLRGLLKTVDASALVPSSAE
jgi:four helix bundle protein